MLQRIFIYWGVDKRLGGFGNEEEKSMEEIAQEEVEKNEEKVEE